jgi:hypothetical protein
MLNAMRCSTVAHFRRVVAIAGLVVLAPIFSTAFAAESPLLGAWQLGPGQPGQAGLYLFTPTRYSMMLSSTDRPDIADTSKASADEFRALWGPLLANSGTYEVSGDLITIHPLVAKIPVVMKSGATEVYRFHIEGKTLTLRQVRNARGAAVEQAPIFKFVRVE